ncbi:murein L,D-transpeptidase catalytic domain family protein [Oleiagrimonas sp. C23AA]|uniref:murein L,D-transpeptidase catalytic domain family protein n=1 Tax=Oleiagrimonas sp. C23AA TaxID=2719047 RepID=UPI00141DFEA8|nr:murein L,D-transpeptidase catalytic domain family protein [Oleiagrimonas sp. C23AA]NII10559.1 murein L,D-transpeptidase catalytic domain family protein [Oleiagrimonas sp. C23AA]
MRSRPLIAIVLLFAPLAAFGAAPTVPPHLAQSLSKLAPRANPKVLALATQALACVRRSRPAHTLSVIDYSLPSTKRRLWVFALGPTPRLLFREWVAHGRNSGANRATRFSNKPGSLMSSLGTFVTDGTYQGHNGYSLRLKGLDGRFNNHAEERAIVIHGAKYVSQAFARREGRLGRSWGCPAVRQGVAHQLIHAISERSVVFAYYPDPAWLKHSRMLGDCGAG